MENRNASGTIIERNDRLKRRNEQDRARRAEESPQQKQERLRKRRERERAILPQLKQGRLRKRRESYKVRSLATRKKDEERLQLNTHSV